MTTPWTIPTSFVNGVVIGATDLNQQVRDNMSHLKSPPLANIVTAIDVGQASTTATTAVPITGGLSATLTTYGAPVQIHFHPGRTITSGTVAVYNLDIDGTAYTDRVSGLGSGQYHLWATGLDSGLHTFMPTWQVTTPGGTAFTDISATPLIFWVREG